MVDDKTKKIHDLVLLAIPEGVEHSCDYCSPEATEATTVADTLTDEDVAAKVAKAVADAISPFEAKIAERDTKIAELTDKLGERDVDDATAKAVADAVAPLETKVAELTDQLDKEVLARGAAENERKALVDWLDTQSASIAVEQRRDSRVAAVKDTGAYPDDVFNESVSANKDRIDGWAAMQDDVFDMLIDGLKAKGGSKTEGNGPIPTTRSAMTDTVTEGTTTGGKSAMKSLLESTIPSLASTQASN